jgi:hypothetical protein
MNTTGASRVSTANLQQKGDFVMPQVNNTTSPNAKYILDKVLLSKPSERNEK